MFRFTRINRISSTLLMFIAMMLTCPSSALCAEIGTSGGTISQSLAPPEVKEGTANVSILSALDGENLVGWEKWKATLVERLNGSFQKYEPSCHCQVSRIGEVQFVIDRFGKVSNIDTPSDRKASSFNALIVGCVFNIGVAPLIGFPEGSRIKTIEVSAKFTCRKTNSYEIASKVVPRKAAVPRAITTSEKKVTSQSNSQKKSVGARYSSDEIHQFLKKDGKTLHGIDVDAEVDF